MVDADHPMRDECAQPSPPSTSSFAENRCARELRGEGFRHRIVHVQDDFRACQARQQPCEHEKVGNIVDVDDIELSSREQTQACGRGTKAGTADRRQRRRECSCLGTWAPAIPAPQRRREQTARRRSVPRRQGEAAHVKSVCRQCLRLTAHSGVGGIFCVGDHADEHFAVWLTVRASTPFCPSKRSS